MSAYYNEFDPKAAATLRELIREGLIAPGDVDERSIEDVTPAELTGYKQVHFFAGFGIWSLALRMAGWKDERPVWTASCPCQPFSQAGKGGGFDDERHLWPAAFWLIQHGKQPCIPVYGEQVASPDGMRWLDLVRSDLEGINHAAWHTVLASAGFGAPIIRQRTYWLARPNSELHNGSRESGQGRRSELADRRNVDGMARPEHDGSRRPEGFAAFAHSDGQDGRLPDGSGSVSGMGSANCNGSQSRRQTSATMGHRNTTNSTGSVSGMGSSPGSRHERLGTESEHGELGASIETFNRLGSPSRAGLSQRDSIGTIQSEEMGAYQGEAAIGGSDISGRPGPTNGFWRDADWLRCRDDKWRPVEPGTFPLAHGYPERVGILRGAGNAISPQVAAAWIKVTMGTL